MYKSADWLTKHVGRRKEKSPMIAETVLHEFKRCSGKAQERKRQKQTEKMKRVRQDVYMYRLNEYLQSCFIRSTRGCLEVDL